MADMYKFTEGCLTVEGEKDDLIKLAELLRDAEGTIGDLRYQIERAFNIDGVSDDELMDEIEYVLESRNFVLHEYRENGNLCGYELEGYTPEFINMIHFLDMRDDKKITPLLLAKKLVALHEQFSVDEAVYVHMLDDDFRKCFSFRDALDDFEKYKETLRDIADELYDYVDRWVE